MRTRAGDAAVLEAGCTKGVLTGPLSVAFEAVVLSTATVLSVGTFVIEAWPLGFSVRESFVRGSWLSARATEAIARDDESG